MPEPLTCSPPTLPVILTVAATLACFLFLKPRKPVPFLCLAIISTSNPHPQVFAQPCCVLQGSAQVSALQRSLPCTLISRNALYTPSTVTDITPCLSALFAAILTVWVLSVSATWAGRCAFHVEHGAVTEQLAVPVVQMHLSNARSALPGRGWRVSSHLGAVERRPLQAKGCKNHTSVRRGEVEGSGTGRGLFVLPPHLDSETLVCTGLPRWLRQ